VARFSGGAPVERGGGAGQGEGRQLTVAASQRCGGEGALRRWCSVDDGALRWPAMIGDEH
jgi:hypothetical protein